MNKIKFLIVLSLFFCLVAQGLCKDKIAVAIKSRGDTKLKKAEEETYSSQLKLGTSLYSQDNVKTGSDGYAMLVFLDDKSQIKIRNNSELSIAGTQQNGAISKKISMDYGKMKADVNPQKKGEFVIATPTSVASVKGTVFWVVSDPVEGDIFYGMSGSVEVTNNESGVTVVVGADETGTSTPDGQVDVVETQEGDVPVDDEETEEGTGGTEEAEPTNSIRIQLQNESGETKELKIEYK